MRTIEIDAASVAEASGLLPGDGPVFILNLLRYKEQADYNDRADAAPCSGREAFHERYVPVFNQIADAGARPVWVGAALARLVGPADELWDDVAIVEYPSFAAFRRVVDSEEYRTEAAPHRLAALEDCRLIAMTKLL
ncbi:MAG: hypothetical protein ABIY70_13220 [Capsulimonas sp.]|uniref:DUF1330 domain-containing protein n=1 Tax=Capsulimonas sp. TaxID=2494211 RepID=UPI003267B778